MARSDQPSYIQTPALKPNASHTLLRIMTAAIISLCGVSVASAQAQAPEEPYKFDLGIGIGMNGYLGDINGSLFHNPGVAASGKFRYRPDTRWAFCGQFSVATLSGDTENLDNVFPGNKQYEFTSTYYDLGARVEFNFFNYGIGETYKKLKRWTPYLGVGAGAGLSTCDGKSYVAFSLPMAFGIKVKLKPRINAGLEFSMTKVFGDHVDGELADLQQIKTSFIRNTDWVAALQLTISFEFGLRCSTCNRLE